jgi:hypothetical protein
MHAKPENGVANVIEMRHLRFIKQDAVLELARIPHHHAVASDYVFAHVTATADVTVFSDPCRTFQDRALFDNRVRTDKNRVADKRLPHEVPKHGAFKTKLQITGDLFESLPNILLRLKQL